MGYDWSFELDEDISPLLRTITMAYECEMAIESDCQHPTIVGRGLRATALAQSVLGRNLNYESLGISTRSCLRCRGDLHAIADVCVRMLKHLSCDMVLFGNGEKPYVLRKDGKVFVDRQPTDPQYSPRFWELTLAAADVAFEACPLPTP